MHRVNTTIQIISLFCCDAVYRMANNIFGWKSQVATEEQHVHHSHHRHCHHGFFTSPPPPILPLSHCTVHTEFPAASKCFFIYLNNFDVDMFSIRSVFVHSSSKNNCRRRWRALKMSFKTIIIKNSSRTRSLISHNNFSFYIFEFIFVKPKTCHSE